MPPLRLLLSLLFFERNEVLGRRSTGMAGLLKKSALAAPSALASMFFNFGAAYPRRRGPWPTARPRLPGSVGRLAIGGPFPSSNGFTLASESVDRGIPLPDSVAAEAIIDGAICRVRDLGFLLSEVRRVCAPGARVRVALPPQARQLEASDPDAVRIVTASTLRAFCTGDRRLFDLDPTELAPLAPEAEGVSLRVHKNESDCARPTTRIDLGCGPAPREGYTGIDLLPGPGVAIVRNIEKHALPFADETISHVFTSHCLEHVRDLIFVMNEIHRVCCHDAVVEIVVPTMLGPWALADPTHVRFFNAHSFSYFEKGGLPGTPPGYAGIVDGFEIRELSVSSSMRVVLRAIKA